MGSDFILFSFGVLLFEMLAGQRPFGGQYDVALSYAIINEEPPKLSDVLPNTPERLSILISRLLEKDPAKRNSFTEDLAGELKACLNELPDSVATSQVTHTATTHHSGSEDASGSGTTGITINFTPLRSQKWILNWS